jgi:hypothetical protein
MTDAIDRALRMLGEAALPAASADTERKVMARIAAAADAREARPSFEVGLGTAAIAVIIGIASVTVGTATEAVPLEMSVFSANAAFAPATLLATEG